MGKKGCIKCGSSDAGQKEVAMTGTGLSKMFDIQHNRFLVVYCKKCGYSEFYNKTLPLQEMFWIFSSADKSNGSCIAHHAAMFFFFRQKILLAEWNVRKLSSTLINKKR